MSRFLAIIFLCVPSVSFGVIEREPCGLSWVPFFEPAIAKEQLYRQLGTRKSIERQRGTLVATAILVGDQIETYYSTQYSTEDAAKKARALHRVVKHFSRDGTLGPFRLAEHKARVNDFGYVELIEGRTVQDLKTDRSLAPERVHQLLEAFQAGLDSVKAHAKDNRLITWDIPEGEKGYGVGVVLDEENKFSILSSKVIVDDQTGVFVLIGVDAEGGP